MSLNWKWSDKCGEITLVQKHPDEQDRTFQLSLYKGNAFLTMLYEYTDEKTGKEMYELSGFWADKDHAKHCLGLSKKDGYTSNIYDTDYNKWTKVRLNKAKYKYTKDLVTMLTQAFNDLTIEIYTDEQEG